MLSEEFGTDCLTAAEVKSHGMARLDIVVLSQSEIIGIEVKRRDWKRALAQAALNRFCVDRSYVALWTTTYIKEAVVTEAKRLSVGVIAVTNDTMQVVLQAPLSFPRPAIRQRILDHMVQERRG